MNILVIYAHPKHDGHCGTILNEVVENLKNKNQEYELLDLQAMNFDPVLKPAETKKNDNPDSVIVEMQKKINNSELLIFIYPVWWNSMPAILKGYFDRVFHAGYAFRYNPLIPHDAMPFFEKLFKLVSVRFDYGMPIGLLKPKKAIVFLTTGSPKVLSYPFTGNRFKKIIKKDTLGFFGIRAKIVHFGNCRILNEWKILEIKKKVKSVLKKIK